MQNRTLTFILAGGMGSRLYPLTSQRSKPAVPFGGKYRIIDFTLTNCLHSGLRRILILTQYKSHSLNKHIRDGWSIFNPELSEYITPVPAQMNLGEQWYRGTADAISQNLNLLERSEADYTLILSGDHIYRMDYEAMLLSHRKNSADVTIACMEVPLAEAKKFGVVVVDDDAKILEFEEKPSNPTPLPADASKAFVSMGLYVFSTDLLIDALMSDQQELTSSHDFGKDILPNLVKDHKVMAYKFGGKEGRVTPDLYWRDVGTIDAYFQANMDLIAPVPPLDLYQRNWPIRTYNPQAPPARTITSSGGKKGEVINSMLASGSVICGGVVENSILFNDIIVEESAMVENSILFSGVRVGKNARLKNCIVDRNIAIPENENIGIDRDMDQQRFTVSSGGVVVVDKI